jgi:putative ABC transport system permease protein
MFLARRNLFQDKVRLFLSVAGVSLAVMLILLLNAFLTGLYRQISSYLDHSPGAVVVVQQGVDNMLAVTSLVPAGTAAAAAAVDGVAAVTPILSQFVILDLHGSKQPAYLVGYDPEKGGGPWRLAAGRALQADDEVVFDRTLAGQHDIVLGDVVDVMGQPFTVVGLSDGTTSWMASYFFVQKTAAERLLGLPGMTSFLLVTPADKAAQEAVRDRLLELPGSNALLKSELAANDVTLFARFFAAPIRLMAGIAFLVGVLVVGLVIYTATVERQREYGVLKAIGASNRTLYQVVAAQAFIASLVGVAGGVLLAYLAANLVMALRPQFLVVLVAADVFPAAVAGLVIALLAALFPARLVAALAPAEVFRR